MPFEPLHKAHAIEQATLVVSFGDVEVSNDAFAEIKKVGEQFKDDFPGQRAVGTFKMEFGPGKPASQRRSDAVLLQRTMNDGTTENELRVERNSVAFSTNYYTRWSDLWGRVQKYFTAYLPHYVDLGPPALIQLQYVDKFVWSGAIEECRPTQLLRPQSKFLCSHIFEATDLWHSHTGIFVWPEQTTKRLLSINVDCIDDQQLQGNRRVVAIATLVADNLNPSAGTPSKISPEACIRLVGERLHQQHALDKEILRDLLTEEFSRRIAL